MATDKDLTKIAIEQAQTAYLTYGCPTKRLMQNLEIYGAVAVIKDLCRRHRLSDGFQELVQCGHPELTPEALAVKSKFGSLFTDDEANWCLQALCEVGYF